MKPLMYAAFISLTALPAAAQTAYPLVCHGGGSMHASVAANGRIILQFNAGTAGAGTGAPTAGECRWLDRAFGGSEPHRLSLGAGSPRDAQYLIDAMLTGGTFYAHVYNDGGGNMIVVRVGP